MQNKKRKRAVNIYRVSTGKQLLIGDSLEEQKRACRRVNKRFKHIRVEEFELAETGAIEKDRIQFEKALQFCKNPQNKINALFLKWLVVLLGVVA